METGLRRIRWSSFDPEIRGETDIMIYEEELHNDLQLMPEGERETYITAYRQKLSAQLSALSRCANPMVTGRGGFDYRRQEKMNKSYRNRYEEFRDWRQKVLASVKRKQETAKPEEEKREKAWQRSSATSGAAPTPSTGLIPDNTGATAVPCSSAAS